MATVPVRGAAEAPRFLRVEQERGFGGGIQGSVRQLEPLTATRAVAYHSGMKFLPVFLSLLLTTACRSDDPDKDTTDGTDAADVLVDGDGDGVIEEMDCDDADASVHPGAPETCNEVDDDCDGEVDEDPADGPVFYYDGDGDGYGIDGASIRACSAPENHAAESGDCDDGDPGVHPDAAEDDCTDPVDYNCDGSVGYADADGDGSPACEDCNDSDESVSPDMEEVCNDGVDDDCDGEADGAGSVGESTWYADTDGDLHGDPEVSVQACEVPDGYVDNATDCNDEAASANPSGVEICDGLDNDCDGEVDGLGAIGGMTLYPDEDGDGHGVESASVVGCESMEGYVSTSGDCDDTTAAVYPGAEEVCDGLDNDCSGGVDEGLLTTVYADPDGDGYGLALVSMESCSVPDGYATSSGDCDEEDALIHPGAEEVCDGADNDCSGGVDEGLLTTVYADSDGDGYGLTLVSMESCGVPDGYAALSGDCDESDGSIHPGAEEVCDGADNDCSGGVDEGLLTTVYGDPDGDGYGLALMPMDACGVPDGYAAMSGDCDETDSTIHPGADEVCDGADNDCSGGVDEGLLSTVYADPDGDGYGLALVASEACGVPDGYASMSGDCDETDGAIHPGAEEVCDGEDNDCSGGVDEGLSEVFYADTDGDGYGVESTAVEACAIPFGHTTVIGDCAPDDGAIHPGATEVCDTVDNNCDDLVDDADDGLDLTSAISFYPDLDLDGYGTGDPVVSCVEPDGYVLDNTDCLDTDEASYPGATEVWYDGVDQDCAGGSDYDADGDGADSVDYGGADSDDADPSCTIGCLFGLTPETAATTCQEILDVSPSAENGTYWIDMGMGAPVETFCDMDGGGWTSCFELVNTEGEDLVGNEWFDRCVEWTMSDNTGSQFRILVQDSFGVDQYDAVGTRPGTWTYNLITSEAGAGDQYHSDSHSLIPLDTGHSLFVSGRSGTQSGCGGSLGNGYVLLVYGPGGNYHNGLKLLLASYYQVSGYTGVRGFNPWTESHELSMATSGTFSSCDDTSEMLGTFRFLVR